MFRLEPFALEPFAFGAVACGGGCTLGNVVARSRRRKSG